MRVWRHVQSRRSDAQPRLVLQRDACALRGGICYQQNKAIVDIRPLLQSIDGTDRQRDGRTLDRFIDPNPREVGSRRGTARVRADLHGGSKK